MALVTVRRSPSAQTSRKTDEAEKKPSDCNEDDLSNRTSRSLNECYFANKGAALVLGGSERGCADQRRSPARAQPQPDIQHHLQSMFYLLRPEETLKMAVKLESAHAGRTRYLVVVCRGDEAALLGMDCNERTTVGLVLRVLADTAIKLDGDGGFSVCVCNQQHIFKPVSVQAMWSALQTLHRASGRARDLNHFAGGPSHAWCSFYEAHVDSDRSCLNEWHAMDCIESRRPPSPDSLRHKPRERDETERVIRSKLKEVMMSVDLDEITSKAIRGRLEEDLDMDLNEYKSFIDQEMLTILGQMDAPTEIFDHVYLGSEWNASNLEELQRNGVRHILNVTREIDNFFPGMFDYLNVRVYDDDKTDLLKHWDNTFKYINKARNEGSKVLVHCKMGISRSASVVIAYAMKAFNWNFDKALKHVKMKRSCIKPNTNFLSQLETYQGILDAMKNKEKLQRSKSETNLKSPKSVCKAENKVTEPTPLILALSGSYPGRPRSWSPDTKLESELLPPTSVSLENLASETRHMLMPCANGSYSVSPNQIIRLKEEGAPSVKHIVNEIEKSSDRKDFKRRSQRLNFGSQSDTSSGRPTEPAVDLIGKPPQISPSRTPTLRHGDADGIHTPPWDPGDHVSRGEGPPELSESDNIVKSDSANIGEKTKQSDALSNSVERMPDGDDRRIGASGEESAVLTPSRHGSWSSFDSGGLGGGGGGGGELSRNSSWGSYDSRRRDEPPAAPDLASISERPPDVAANERKFNETCAILKELANAAARELGASTWSGRLAASAPADTWLRAGPPRRRRLAAASHGDLPRAAAAAAAAVGPAPLPLPLPLAPPPPPAAGKVSNLKKEFEARSAEAAARPAVPAPDPKKSRLGGALALRNSFCGAVRGERPPPAPTVLALAPLDYPNVLVSTVMSKAQSKKQLQHGKTHPLTRLNLNRSNNRCSNPVYNTM